MSTAVTALAGIAATAAVPLLLLAAFVLCFGVADRLLRFDP